LRQLNGEDWILSINSLFHAASEGQTKKHPATTNMPGINVDTIQKQHKKVNVQVQCTTEALDRRSDVTSEFGRS